jgi:uncharacterized Ntn-hydrolase superfamily protein
MTFTVIALDRPTGQLGIAIATYSLAVGASCPFTRPGVGAVSTQAATYSAHGPAVLDALEAGMSAGRAVAELRMSDPYFEFRQVGVVAADGTAVVHTGERTRRWAGAATGSGWLTMGNVLAGEQVVEAMADALREAEGQPLAERLVAALEAGRDAGGQAGAHGEHLTERSAVVTVYGSARSPLIDLRVDAHESAVTELRRIFDLYMQADEYYQSRSERPDITPPQDEWMRQRGLA